MDRPTMDQVYIEFAQTVARRSLCKRRVQVGCVVTNWERTNVVAIGYNGPARSLPHECDPNLVQYTVGVPAPGVYSSEQHDQMVQYSGPKPGSCTCVHAEANALIKAPYDQGDLRLYTTLSPCAACARLILNSRVREVVCLEEYRDDQGLKILAKGGVFFRMVTENYEDLKIAGSVVHRFKDGTEVRMAVL